MAYKSRDFSIVQYANGFTLWHYTTTDAAENVGAPGYFNDAADMMRVGDMILVNADTDGLHSAGQLHVQKNSGTVIETTWMVLTEPAAA